jgi:hypothetical protein
MYIHILSVPGREDMPFIGADLPEEIAHGIAMGKKFSTCACVCVYVFVRTMPPLKTNHQNDRAGFSHGSKNVYKEEGRILRHSREQEISKDRMCVIYLTHVFHHIYIYIYIYICNQNNVLCACV